MKVKTVSILGCGWFGFALAKELIQLGYTVKGSTTTPEKLPLLHQENIQPYLIDFTASKIVADQRFFDADVLFICIPPKRNSPVLNDYPGKIQSIVEAAREHAKEVIMISSSSVYGEENKMVNELSETHPDTDSGKMVLAAENILNKENADHATIIRFAGLIGPDRNPGRFFAGKTDVPNGLAPVNLIHQTDAVGIACKILARLAFGKTYNACAPQHPTKKEFYTQAARKSNLAEPVFLEEKKDWKIVESLNVPEFLDYDFQVEIG